MPKKRCLCESSAENGAGRGVAVAVITYMLDEHRATSNRAKRWKVKRCGTNKATKGASMFGMQSVVRAETPEGRKA